MFYAFLLCHDKISRGDIKNYILYLSTLIKLIQKLILLCQYLLLIWLLRFKLFFWSFPPCTNIGRGNTQTPPLPQPKSRGPVVKSGSTTNHVGFQNKWRIFYILQTRVIWLYSETLLRDLVTLKRVVTRNKVP